MISTAPFKRVSIGRWSAPVASRLLLTALLATLAGCDEPPSAQDPLKLATEIQDRIITIDSHIDIPLDFATPADDPLKRPDEQVDLENMKLGGLRAGFFIVYVGQTVRDEAGYARAQEEARTKFDAIRRMALELHPDRIGLATTADEVRKVHGEGRLVALIGIENGFAIGKNLSLLETYYDLGGRYMTLVHNGHNDIGDSAQPRESLGDDGPEHGGLSDFGQQVVAEMNRLGMMVDISHVSKDTMMQATGLSAAPVIASHSSVKGVFDHPRNLDDEQLQAVRDKGGVVQIVAFDSYLKAVPPEKSASHEALRQALGIKDAAAFRNMSEATRAQYMEGRAMLDAQWPGADVADLVDHIDYAVGQIGINHVGISSDFGGGGGVIGWNHAVETFNVTHELVRRGYTEEDITRLWGGNLLRVMGEVEAVARQQQGQNQG